MQEFTVKATLRNVHRKQLAAIIEQISLLSSSSETDWQEKQDNKIKYAKRRKNKPANPLIFFGADGSVSDGKQDDEAARRKLSSVYAS